MKVRSLRIADQDALNAALWYDSREPGLGREFLNEWENVLEAVGNNPDGCPQYEFSPDQRPLFRHRFHRFPYLLIIEKNIDEMVVLAVHPLARDTAYLKRRQS